MQRLHATIEPAFFASNFRPMNHLVSVLSAEAKNRQKMGSPQVSFDEDDDDDPDDPDIGDDELFVHTLEGKMVRVRGLSRLSTVTDLRRAVEAQAGALVDDQRLYVDAMDKSHSHSGLRSAGELSGTARFELLKDGATKLEDLGVFPAELGEAPVASVHLRNREYEALRSQLETATEVVETLLEDHFDTFNTAVASAQDMAARYETLKGVVGEARRLVSDARARLGLRHATDPGVVLLDEEEEAKRSPRIIEHWEAVVEADEALSLLEELRTKCLSVI